MVNNSEPGGEVGNQPRRRWYEPLVTLGKQWIQFVELVLSPLIVGLGLCLVFMLAARVELQNAESSAGSLGTMRIVLDIAAAVLAGGIGAIVDRRFSGAREKTVLTTRGRSAIRGLRILHSHINSLRSSLINSKSESSEHTTFRDRVVSRLELLQDQTINAIDDWQDIVPEANVGFQLQLIQELRAQQTADQEKYQSLKDQLETQKVNLGSESSKLQQQLAEAHEKLRKTEGDLLRKQAALANTISVPSSGSSPFRGGLLGNPVLAMHDPSHLGGLLGEFHTCKNCGALFTANTKTADGGNKPICTFCQTVQ